VTQEVSLLLTTQLDMQQLRRLAQQMAGRDGDDDGGSAAAPNSSSSGEQGGLQVADHVLNDPELLALITKRGKGGSYSGGAHQRRTLPMTAAERKLRALLRPAAMQLVSDAAMAAAAERG